MSTDDHDESTNDVSGFVMTELPLQAECEVNRAARAAWRDPLQYRRECLPVGSRGRLVLNEVARRSDWSRTPPAGVARGVAMGEAEGAWMAMVAEVSGDSAGTRVRRLVVAVDCGPIIDNHDARRAVLSGMQAGLRAAVDDADAVPMEVWWVCGGDVPGRGGLAIARRTVAPAIANALSALHTGRARTRALAALSAV